MGLEGRGSIEGGEGTVVGGVGWQQGLWLRLRDAGLQELIAIIFFRVEICFCCGCPLYRLLL
jgi:hypothetical protein